MVQGKQRAVAIVGMGAVLPDAPDVAAFFENLKSGRSSITDVPPDRWDPKLFHAADPSAPDKTYSKIGAWVGQYPWSPLEWGLPIPPKVSEAMDASQKLAVAASREALRDYGHPERPLDQDRTAVILGNAMGGELHYLTSLRAFFPEYAKELESTVAFQSLSQHTRMALLEELHVAICRRYPPITEDTMPGELGNIVAGRVAALFDFHGPNYITDAACASSLAAIDAAIAGLHSHYYDAVLTGGIDTNMGVSSFVKFSKIGALSATGSRPYHDKADGFVMGEGGAVFLLKRLEDAERDGDRVYAVIRGVGGSSDGRGKGITAPNPVGQELSIRRGWENAGIAPGSATYIEGHGTSTRVGDLVELQVLGKVFSDQRIQTIPIGSVKSNIGHLKSAAGAASLLKVALSLHNRLLLPSLGEAGLNPGYDFSSSPLFVNKEAREWDVEQGRVRNAGVSAFGFGGTNFHVVLEEYVPGRIDAGRRRGAPSLAGSSDGSRSLGARPVTPLRGALLIGGETEDEVATRLREVHHRACGGEAPPFAEPLKEDLEASVRVAIDYGSASELAVRSEKAIEALDKQHPGIWKALRNQGVFMGRGRPGRLAFLYPGQGSQYVNMLAGLHHQSPIVKKRFAEADEAMSKLLDTPLSSFIFTDPSDEAGMKTAERGLRETEITQPAVLTVDTALTDLLASHGLRPDMVMGHSLGEYGALVASGALPFADALEAVAGRGREMAAVEVEDRGLMVAVFAPLEKIQQAVDASSHYVVVANINSNKQAVIGGSTPGVGEVTEALIAAGYRAVPLPVSHAFHTQIVAPAAEPLRRLLQRLRLCAPAVPVVANIDGELYPSGQDVKPRMVDILARQIASPVQFVKGLRTMYDHGCRVFVEVGPKKVLAGFVDDVLGHHPDVISLFTNHPKQGDIESFNHALCGLYAAGFGESMSSKKTERVTGSVPQEQHRRSHVHSLRAPAASTPASARKIEPASTAPRDNGHRYEQLGRLLEDFITRGSELLGATTSDRPSPFLSEETGNQEEPIVVTGAGLGLPGGSKVFGDEKIPSLLHGKQMIGAVPEPLRRGMAQRRVHSLVKNKDGGGYLKIIDKEADVIKLAGRGGTIDLVSDFGIPEKRAESFDRATALAIGAGIDALRDAGIPLVMQYRDTTTGRRLPNGPMLPESYRDSTGVIFASAFPGLNSLASEMNSFHRPMILRSRLQELHALKGLLHTHGANGPLAADLEKRVRDVEAEIERAGYGVDRKFLFKVVSFGHAQFAEHIGARGPNTQVNAACASTTLAVSLAEDWIKAGRCDRVVVVSGDDVTSEHLMEWIGSGFLATGAAAIDERVEDAALPFDRRRHGMLLGMGAAGIVVEAAASARARAVRPIAEVLGTVTANSAFHGTRLDTSHIRDRMEQLISNVERKWGIDRRRMAPETVFVSHETATPARGGSSQAEIDALRHVFGPMAEQILITNTKGYTGHAMGAGIEDVLAIKSLETGFVPAVPNHKETDPDLGPLKLSTGGRYPVHYALRVGAGFGSQICLTLYRLVSPPGGRRPEPNRLGFEGRVEDPAGYTRWIEDVTGLSGASTVVEGRVLRVRDGDLGDAQEPGRPEPVQPSPADEAREEPVPAAAASSQTAQDDPVRERVLEIVAAQTGYPKEMLDLDLDLEADLGIDTVKQAEMFAAVREQYGIERDDNLALRDYPTLAAVIDFVYERAPGITAPADEARLPPTEQPVQDKSLAPPALIAGDDEQSARLLRRAPVPVLRPSLELCAGTGVELGEGSRVIIMHDAGGTGSVLQNRLERRGVEVLSIRVREEITPEIRGRRCAAAARREERGVAKATRATSNEVRRRCSGVRNPEVILSRALRESPDSKRVEEAARAFAEGGAVTGVYWLAALDDDSPVSDLDLDGWRESLHVRVKLLYRIMRRLHDQVGGRGTFLVTATRLGGQHGYGTGGALHPMGGAVTGFTKAYKRENPKALVKAVDFEQGGDREALADCLIAETLRDPGAVEIGCFRKRRFTISLQDRELTDRPHGMSLDSKSVFVVTGAAGSIVAAIVADLAAASRGTFHLLDLVGEPDRRDPDIAAFLSDKEALKKTLFERMKASGGRATPALIDKELARLERSANALSAIRAVEDAGGVAHYHEVNLLDAEAMGSVMTAIRRAHEKVDVLIHAAGIEKSRLLSDKEPDEYDLVFDVKADGWFNLQKGLEGTPLGAAVVFSSVAGRFGNSGQTDYSAANDLLCKCIAHLRCSQPETRGVAIDWTAWGDIGMATRGSIPTMMKAAGIDMLPARAGVPVVRRELSHGSGSREIVIGLGLGALLDEWSETGGLDLSSGGPTAELLDDAGLMAGSIGGMGIHRGLEVTTVLDPTTQPFLDHHRIDDIPVLPGVMGIEAFVSAACLIFPDHFPVAVENVEFHAPFKFYRDEPRAAGVSVQYRLDGEDVLAYCVLSGERRLATEKKPRLTTHFTGRVRLSQRRMDVPTRAVPETLEGSAGAADIYGIYFHGPAYQVLETVGRSGDEIVGRMAGGLPTHHVPRGARLLTRPLLAELCFQAAGAFAIGTFGGMELPSSVEEIRLFVPEGSPGRVTALVRRAETGAYDGEVVDETGRILVRISGYRTSAVPTLIDEELARPLREAMKAEPPGGQGPTKGTPHPQERVDVRDRSPTVPGLRP